mgnify:CR=1 FL=1
MVAKIFAARGDFLPQINERELLFGGNSADHIVVLLEGLDHADCIHPQEPCSLGNLDRSASACGCCFCPVGMGGEDDLYPFLLCCCDEVADIGFQSFPQGVVDFPVFPTFGDSLKLEFAGKQSKRCQSM